MAAAVIWGLNFPVVKAVLREMEPLAFNALRFPCAAFAVWFLLKAQGRRLMPYRKDWRTVIALGAAGHVVFQVCFIFGLDLTLTGNAAILLSTTPVWVLLISAALGRERFNLPILVGVVATLAGMVILVTGGGDAVGSAGGGDLLVLGAAVSWSVYTVFGRRMTKRRGVLEMTAWTLWAGLPFIVLMGIPDLVRTDWGAGHGGVVARRRVRRGVRHRGGLPAVVPRRARDRAEPHQRLPEPGPGDRARRRVALALGNAHSAAACGRGRDPGRGGGGAEVAAALTVARR